MKTHKNLITSEIIRKFLFSLLALCFLQTAFQCKPDDPDKEDTPELITSLTLKFAPTGGGDPIEVTATDPDGEGVADIEPDGPIVLNAGTTYTLELSLINGLVPPTDGDHNITLEVEEEGDEHLFFFSWTGNVFSSPAGNGNIDNRTDPMQYLDTDAKGRPLGLSTRWTASSSAASGDFRIVLKHQPDQKTDTSGSTVGETDLDLVFEISVQ